MGKISKVFIKTAYIKTVKKEKYQNSFLKEEIKIVECI